MIIHRQINCIALLLILLWTTGCSSVVTRQSGLSSATPPTPTILEEQPTQTQLPISRLQVTYVRETSDGVEGVYAIDVTCQTDDKLCLGDPKLLFQTSPSSSGDLSKPTGYISSYKWSPDGNKIVLSASEDIFIGDMNTQEWTNITNSAEMEEYDPKWSSDGKYIYYLSCSRELGYGFCRLARSTPKGEVKIDLLNLVDNSIDYFTVSPDERIVVFSAPKDGFGHLYQSNLDGSEMRLITTAELEEKYPALEETYPSFSPDGGKLVFMRAYYSLPVGISKQIVDLIIRDINSGEEKNLTEELEDEAFSPVFSPEGEWIVFSAFDTNLNSNIFIVSINEGIIIQVMQGIIDKGAPSWRLARNQ